MIETFGRGNSPVGIPGPSEHWLFLEDGWRHNAIIEKMFGEGKGKGERGYSRDTMDDL